MFFERSCDFPGCTNRYKYHYQNVEKLCPEHRPLQELTPEPIPEAAEPEPKPRGPRRPLRACAHSGLGHPLYDPSVHKRGCPECNKTRDREYRADRKYNAAEDKFRLEVLKNNPICQMCGRKPANTLHHVKPVKTHPELALNFTNAVGICSSCHGKIEHGGVPLTLEIETRLPTWATVRQPKEN